jgi:hypothetical protein
MLCLFSEVNGSQNRKGYAKLTEIPQTAPDPLVCDSTTWVCTQTFPLLVHATALPVLQSSGAGGVQLLNGTI